MKKEANDWILTIGKGIFGGVLVMQLVLAFVWGIRNLGVLQGFSESALYFGAGDAVGGAGRTSALYQFFVMLFGKSSLVISIVQLCVCAVLVYSALAAFQRGITGRMVPGVPVFFGMVLIITNPFVWTMIFSVQPCALAFAVALVVLAYGFLYMKRVGDKGCNAFLAVVLSGIVFLFFIDIRYCTATVLITGVMTAAGIVRILIKPELRKDGVNFIMPGIVTVSLLIYLIAEFGKIPYLEATTKEGAALVKDICKGLFSHTAAPFFLTKSEYPYGDSMNPYLYAVLWQHKPALTMFFFKACSAGYAVCVSYMLLAVLLHLPFSDKEGRKKILSGNFILYAMVILSAVALFFAGRTEYDFRLLLLPLALWGIAGFTGIWDLTKERIIYPVTNGKGKE